MRRWIQLGFSKLLKQVLLFTIFAALCFILLKKFEQSFFAIFSVRVANQWQWIICGTESVKKIANISKIVVLRLRMRMICWKKNHFTFRKFSSINIPFTSFGRLWLFNSLHSLRPLFIFVGFGFQFIELNFCFQWS